MEISLPKIFENIVQINPTPIPNAVVRQSASLQKFHHKGAARDQKPCRTLLRNCTLAITVIVEFGQSSGMTKVAVTEVGLPLIVKILSRVFWDQQFDKIEGLL